MPLLTRRLRAYLRPFVPQRVKRCYLTRASQHARYRTGSPRDIFGAIYRDGIWGSGADFMSGAGSHDPAIVDPYVAAVTAFARAHPGLRAVDLGCGDFAVGQRLVGLFERYTACDVVPALIERNRGKFIDPGLSFAAVDLVADALPVGDVAFVRQVLQHLSNDQIAAVLPKLRQYRFVIVTEQVPGSAFPPNADKQPGPTTRLQSGSGVDLAAPPFVLERPSKLLCRVPVGGSAVETRLWS